jgi:hypothetical protein
MQQRIYFRLNWRDYFKTTASQFKKMKKERTLEVYQKLYREVKTAVGKRLKENLIALDENTRTVLSVPNTDYVEVLQLCQTNLEQNEDYESCADIRDTLIKLQSTPRKRKLKDAQKLLLIKRN